MPSTHLFATIRTVPLQRGLRRCGAHTHAHTTPGGKQGEAAESARTSLSEGGSLENGKDSKLAEKDLAAATDNNPDHRPTKAAIAAARCRRRAVRIRARANHRTKLAASALQHPPTSMPLRHGSGCQFTCYRFLKGQPRVCSDACLDEQPHRCQHCERRVYQCTNDCGIDEPLRRPAVPSCSMLHYSKDVLASASHTRHRHPTPVFVGDFRSRSLPMCGRHPSWTSAATEKACPRWQRCRGLVSL